MEFILPYKDGRALLRLSIQPRASRNGFIAIHNDTVKLAITAAPVKGKANAAVIGFLASFFNLKKKDLEIKSGLQSRLKSVLVNGLLIEEIRGRIVADCQKNNDGFLPGRDR